MHFEIFVVKKVVVLYLLFVQIMMEKCMVIDRIEEKKTTRIGRLYGRLIK